MYRLIIVSLSNDSTLIDMTTLFNVFDAFPECDYQLIVKSNVDCELLSSVMNYLANAGNRPSIRISSYVSRDTLQRSFVVSKPKRLLIPYYGYMPQSSFVFDEWPRSMLDIRDLCVTLGIPYDYIYTLESTTIDDVERDMLYAKKFLGVKKMLLATNVFDNGERGIIDTLSIVFLNMLTKYSDMFYATSMRALYSVLQKNVSCEMYKDVLTINAHCLAKPCRGVCVPNSVNLYGKTPNEMRELVSSFEGIELDCSKFCDSCYFRGLM